MLYYRVWVKNVEPLKDYFHSTHLIVIVPAYSDANIKEAVKVNVTVKCGGKESDNFMLTYLPTHSMISMGKNLGHTMGSTKGGVISTQHRGHSGGGSAGPNGQAFTRYSI